MQVLLRQRETPLMALGSGGTVNRKLFGNVARPWRTPRGRRMSARPDQGFTLVELMITLAVAVILVIIAVPNFSSIIATNKLTTTANDIVAAINIARMEAIKRNGNTAFCSDSATNNTSDTLGAICGTQAGAVYLLTSGTNTTQVRAGVVGITSPVQLHGSMAALRFNSAGLAEAVGSTTPFNGTVADICTSTISGNNHQVITMSTGSILVVTTSPGACP